MDSREDLEEERRLFYVAITRACESCTLSYATTRFKWGQLHQGDPSRFLDEIDEQYLIQPAGIIRVQNIQARRYWHRMKGAHLPDGVKEPSRPVSVDVTLRRLIYLKDIYTSTRRTTQSCWRSSWDDGSAKHHRAQHLFRKVSQ